MNYDHLDKSVPPALCNIDELSAPYLENCVISPNLLVIYAKIEIPDRTLLRITIEGAKNPAFVGLTADDAF